jgi:antitoxin (DNA-binding transcriptional repressor) of toxin-antitoxin stability system
MASSEAFPHPFDHHVTQDGRVRVAREGRVVVTVAGAAAARLVAALERAAERADEDEVQLLLARATGNYRRGNEKRPHRP